ncbi:MaoC family dehydratase [Halalkalirubrum salinum]|uniref:MaoC family dehydratase n=1 Tax=Halalkalirubrum salinum TaxID=2563889 RepID=UPI0010FB9D95|nr:MaoC family dehydratase [Halalkalirubrum salinum]
MVRYFSDLTEGETASYGHYDVTESEIRSFAERYDPQWFHTDRERATEESIYGGLIASGWHTAAMTMRLLVEGVLDEIASVGAKGVDELRWRRPVRPGDTLSIRNEIQMKTVETDTRGLVRSKTETINQDNEVVFSMVGLVMVARRTGDSPADGGGDETAQ